MKKNYSNLAGYEIDIKFIIKKLWKDKIIILLICIISALLGYLNYKNNPALLKSSISLRVPPPYIFHHYKEVINTSDLGSLLSLELNRKLISRDNLSSFIEKNKEFDDFKKIKISKLEENRDLAMYYYYIIYEKKLNGDNFLTSYVQFTLKESKNEIREIIKNSILATLNNYENAYQISKKISLKEPIIEIEPQINIFVSEPSSLFYRGEKVLLEQINILKKANILLATDEFNYNIILDKPVSEKLSENSSSLNINILQGLIAGLFFYSSTIFIRRFLKKNS